MADIERLPEILQAVSQERREELQRNLARVWQRYSYSSWRPYAKRIRQLQQERANASRTDGAFSNSSNSSNSSKPLSLPDAAVQIDLEADDAFHTTMSWLYTRIDAAR